MGVAPGIDPTSFIKFLNNYYPPILKQATEDGVKEYSAKLQILSQTVESKLASARGGSVINDPGAAASISNEITLRDSLVAQKTPAYQAQKTIADAFYGADFLVRLTGILLKRRISGACNSSHLLIR